MAVKRIWFPNRPTGTVDELQRCQLSIGYPFVVQSAVVPPAVATYVDYIRNYLGDNLETLTALTAVTVVETPVSGNYTKYLRNYLGDNDVNDDSI